MHNPSDRAQLVWLEPYGHWRVLPPRARIRATAWRDNLGKAYPLELQVEPRGAVLYGWVSDLQMEASGITYPMWKPAAHGPRPPHETMLADVAALRELRCPLWPGIQEWAGRVLPLAEAAAAGLRWPGTLPDLEPSPSLVAHAVRAGAQPPGDNASAGFLRAYEVVARARLAVMWAAQADGLWAHDERVLDAAKATAAA